MNLTLLRHGETQGSRERLYYGATDLPVLLDSLDSLKRLSALGVYPTGKRYYTSDLKRTEQTLRAIYGDVPFEVLPGLREMDFGDFEMKSYETLKDNPDFLSWVLDSEHNTCPNGESAPMVLGRSLNAIAPILAMDEDSVCVIHGGVIASLMVHWFGGTRYDYSLVPGTGYEVKVSDGRPMEYERIPKCLGNCVRI